jgi:hypothetical protein
VIETYRWAVILDRFTGLTPADLARLTDWQIEHLYLYPREPDGKLKPPEVRPKRKMDVEAHVRAFLAVAQATNATQPGAFPDEAIAATIEEIRRHHGERG